MVTAPAPHFRWLASTSDRWSSLPAVGLHFRLLAFTSGCPPPLIAVVGGGLLLPAAYLHFRLTSSTSGFRTEWTRGPVPAPDPAARGVEKDGGEGRRISPANSGAPLSGHVPAACPRPDQPRPTPFGLGPSGLEPLRLWSAGRPPGACIRRQACSGPDQARPPWPALPPIQAALRSSFAARCEFPRREVSEVGRR